MATSTAFEEKDLLRIVKYFKGAMAIRNRALILFGCGTGFRINEILTLRRNDVLNKCGNYRESVTLFCSKTDKQRTIKLNPLVIKHLDEWLKVLERNGYELKEDHVFISLHTGKPIKFITAYLILKNACRYLNIRKPYSTHSMRKYFGKNIYMFYADRRNSGEVKDPLIKAKEGLGHVNIKDTERYLNFMLGNVSEAVDHLFDRSEVI